MKIVNCRSCGAKRGEFSFEELSPETQKIWKETGMVDSVEYFLLCPGCDELSAIFRIEYN